MRIVRFSVNVMLLLAVLSSVVFAGGFENPTVGTQAGAMSGAFRAVADDWTAAYYNPAGYAGALDDQLGGQVAFFHLRNELTPNYRWGGVYETGVYNDQVNYNNHAIHDIPSAGFIIRTPYWNETVVGFSIFQPFDYNIGWRLYTPLLAYDDSVSVPDDQFQTNLDVVAFQITAAREFVEDKLSLGLGVQILRADLLFNNLLFRNNPLIAIDPNSEVVSRPADKIPQYNSNDGYGFGFGLTGGALWTLNDKMKVAFTAQVPFDITITGSTVNEYYLPNKQTLWYNTDSVDIGNAGTVGQLFLSGETVRDYSDFETTLSLPTRLGIGISYAVTDKFMVALDAEYSLWSTFEGFEFEYSNHTGLNGPADTAAIARDFFTSDVTYETEWDASAKVALGMRYDYSALLTFLAGASFDQSPALSADQFGPSFVDTGDKRGLSGGVVFHIQQWDLGLSTSYTSYDDRTVAMSSGFGYGEDFLTFPGDYSAETFQTVLSFNYRF